MTPKDIKIARKVVRITRADLKTQLDALGCRKAGKRLGVDESTTSRWAAGKREPKIEDTLDLLERLNDE
jgi:transcriptional regulator with XRE-family HTH domain